MIGCLRTRVRKRPIIALYFEFEDELKFHNLEARKVSHSDLMASQEKFHLNYLLASGKYCGLLLAIAKQFGSRS